MGFDFLRALRISENPYNEWHLLSQDNREVYRGWSEPEQLCLIIDGEFAA